jgi:hypothetical protein
MKKNEIMSFAGKCMGLEIVMLSKITQTDEYTYYIFSLICGILKGGVMKVKVDYKAMWQGIR